VTASEFQEFFSFDTTVNITHKSGSVCGL